MKNNMVLYKCIEWFPNGPSKGEILRRGNHVYDYISRDNKAPLSLSSRIVESSPKFFKHLDWLPGSFKNQNNGNVYTLNIDKFPAIEYYRSSCIMRLDMCLERYKINSVLKISTGEIFTVGQHALYTSNPMSPKRIKRFAIIDNVIYVTYEGDSKPYSDFIGDYCNPFCQKFVTEDGVSKQTGDTWYHIAGVDVRNNFKSVLKHGPTLIEDGIMGDAPDSLRFHSKDMAIQYAERHKTYNFNLLDIQELVGRYAKQAFWTDNLVEKYLQERDEGVQNLV